MRLYALKLTVRVFPALALKQVLAWQSLKIAALCYKVNRLKMPAACLNPANADKRKTHFLFNDYAKYRYQVLIWQSDMPTLADQGNCFL